MTLLTLQIASIRLETASRTASSSRMLDLPVTDPLMPSAALRPLSTKSIAAAFLSDPGRFSRSAEPMAWMTSGNTFKTPVNNPNIVFSYCCGKHPSRAAGEGAVFRQIRVRVRWFCSEMAINCRVNAALSASCCSMACMTWLETTHTRISAITPGTPTSRR